MKQGSFVKMCPMNFTLATHAKDHFLFFSLLLLNLPNPNCLTSELTLKLGRYLNLFLYILVISLTKCSYFNIYSHFLPYWQFVLFPFLLFDKVI